MNQPVTNQLLSFTPLRERELEIVRKLNLRSSQELLLGLGDTNTQTDVAYTHDGMAAFTHCVVRFTKQDGEQWMAVGASKRVTYAPMADEENRPRGEDIAFSRAWRAALEGRLICLKGGR